MKPACRYVLLPQLANGQLQPTAGATNAERGPSVVFATAFEYFRRFYGASETKSTVGK